MRFFKKNTPGHEGETRFATGDPTTAPVASVHAVPMPAWHFGLRALQLLFAILVLGLAAYAEHVFSDSDVSSYPPYVLALIVAVLTLLIFLPLAVVHQKRAFQVGVAFAADLVPMLLWIATMAVVASYSALYSSFLTDVESSLVSNETYELYGGGTVGDVDILTITVKKQRDYYNTYKELERGWACGAAAAAFSGIEFLLFLMTTLLFIRYYHLHRLGSAIAPHFGTEQGRGTTAASPHTNSNMLDKIHESGAAANPNQHELQRQYPAPQAGNRPVTPPNNPGLTSGDHTAAPETKTIHEEKVSKQPIVDSNTPSGAGPAES